MGKHIFAVCLLIVIAAALAFAWLVRSIIAVFEVGADFTSAVLSVVLAAICCALLVLVLRFAVYIARLGIKIVAPEIIALTQDDSTSSPPMRDVTPSKQAPLPLFETQAPAQRPQQRKKNFSPIHEQQRAGERP